MTKIFIALSKKSKKDNPRSAFLSAFMSELANNPNVVNAFSGKDRSAFDSALQKLGKSLAAKMPNLNKG